MELPELIELLIVRSQRAVHAHYAAANRLQYIDRMAIGLSTLGGILIAVIGLCAELERERMGSYGLIASGLISLIGLVLLLAAVGQAVWRWGARAQHHKDMGTRYAGARRHLELLAATPPVSRADLREIIVELDELGLAASLVPARFWNKAWLEDPEQAGSRR